MSNLEVEIAELKRQAVEEYERYKSAILAGDFELKDEVKKALIEDSAAELDRTPVELLDKVLKDRGVSRADRRRIVAQRRNAKAVDVPEHTRRANQIARKQAVARELKKLTQ